MVFLIILGIAIMAGIIYLAVSKKSTFMVRIAALGALALMVATVIVCIVMFAKGSARAQPMLLPDMDISDIPPMPSGGPSMTLIMFIIFMLALFAMVTALSLREQGKLGGFKFMSKEKDKDKGKDSDEEFAMEDEDLWK
jgi:hypothetical protein